MSMTTLLLAAPLAVSLSAQSAPRQEASLTAAEVIAAATSDEWRDLDQENALYLYLPAGRVVVELAPEFAPRHVESVKALVRGGYFDGGAVQRSQDNYVVQWATRPLEDGEQLPTPGASPLPPEFEVPAEGLGFTAMPDADVYAPEVGFVRGFPAGRDPEVGVAWMIHCYGVVGVARANDPTSGDGSALYAVIGQSPRHLDRNLAMVGRVVAGMEHLSTLPRGTEALGFYASDDEWVVISRARIGSDMAPGERDQLQLLRTESDSFRELVMLDRSRHDDWFVYPSDRIGVCNARLPTRQKPSP